MDRLKSLVSGEAIAPAVLFSILEDMPPEPMDFPITSFVRYSKTSSSLYVVPFPASSMQIRHSSLPVASSESLNSSGGGVG